MIPAFSTFKKEIFNKLSDKEKSFLFYWSLLDPSHWEEEIPEYIPNHSRGKARALSILKKKSKIFKRFITKDKDFCQHFVWSEILTNYLIGAQVEKDMKEGGLRGRVDRELRRLEFPDLRMKCEKFGLISIEIKSSLSGAHLGDRIYNEVIKNINVRKEKSKKEYKRFLLILLFPSCRNEAISRISQLVEGFYIYQDIVRIKTRVNCRVLCQCVAEKYSSDYSLDNLSKRIIMSFGELSKEN